MPSAQQLEYIKNLISTSPIFIASKSYCPFCRAAKSTISQYPIKANVLELDKRDDGAHLQNALEKLTKQRTVPFVFIGGKFIGGNSDLQALQSSDKLESLISQLKK